MECALKCQENSLRIRSAVLKVVSGVRTDGRLLRKDADEPHT